MFPDDLRESYRENEADMCGVSKPPTDIRTRVGVSKSFKFEEKTLPDKLNECKPPRDDDANPAKADGCK
jgi:hypothetical protein